MGNDQPTGVTVTTGEVAEQIGIPPHQVRRWAKYHAEHLSPGAYPGPNLPGMFTARDVEVLRAAKPFHDKKLSKDIINERLSNIAIGDVDNEPTEDEQDTDSKAIAALQQAQDSPSATVTALAVVDALQSALAPLESRVVAQAARLEALESQRPTWRDVFIIGLAALVVGVMIGLSIWWFQ